MQICIDIRSTAQAMDEPAKAVLLADSASDHSHARSANSMSSPEVVCYCPFRQSDHMRILPISITQAVTGASEYRLRPEMLTSKENLGSPGDVQGQALSRVICSNAFCQSDGSTACLHVGR